MESYLAGALFIVGVYAMAQAAVVLEPHLEGKSRLARATATVFIACAILGLAAILIVLYQKGAMEL